MKRKCVRIYLCFTKKRGIWQKVLVFQRCPMAHQCHDHRQVRRLVSLRKMKRQYLTNWSKRFVSYSGKRCYICTIFFIEWRLNEMYENQAVVIDDEYISFANEKTFIDGLFICFGWRWQNFEVVEVSAETDYAMPLFLISIFVLTFARPLAFHLSFMSKMEFPTPKFLRYVVAYL